MSFLVCPKNFVYICILLIPFLFNSTDEFCELDWHTKFKIIKGTCEGLKYIHEERIYHLDLKPDNILLDKDMVPKIADFGLSRIFDKELACTSEHRYGTL